MQFQTERRVLNIVILSFALLVCLPTFAQSQTQELRRLESRAKNVTITRDDWGIAHVVGKTDADAVFGAIYAQAEDDFNRVETNYINAMGRLAEAEGEAEIWRDLRMKIFIDPAVLKRDFAGSPSWLKKLMTAWADGLNFYLAKHPEVKPRVIKHFEPWMALSFTEGSIGGDIESISLDRLRSMYGGIEATTANSLDAKPLEPSGSNGFAIAPKNTKDGKALLLINPHTSFFFRSELQMTSGEGLNAYGASTWGQFFIYQGWNEHCGWMHTSSAADAIDEYLETITKKGKRYFYKYGNAERTVTETTIRVPYKTASGMSSRTFTVYRTHHGPVVRKTAENGQWVTISLMNKPINALMQSYGRTKAKNLAEYKKVMELQANSSNNTLYADGNGNIAYFHVNYVPRRDPKFDWTRPVDGSDPATDHKGLLRYDELPNLENPATGWVYNSNDWPWAAAGTSSLKRADFPRYVDNGVESARGIHAVRVLENKTGFTLDRLRDAAFDSYLTWFEKTIPALVRAWDAAPAGDPVKAKTKEQIEVLRDWDKRWSVDSVATSMAVFWGEDVSRAVMRDPARGQSSVENYIAANAPAGTLLRSLAAASDKLTADFGKWQTPWGEINRFQRLTDDIVHPFTDAGPSIPVGFTSARWGSLASFGANSYKGSRRIYGTSGNSFVAVVEFANSIRANAVTAGGESGDKNSKHFNDQAERYATGDLRSVYFYPAQLKGHTERVYQPGN